MTENIRTLILRVAVSHAEQIGGKAYWEREAVALVLALRAARDMAKAEFLRAELYHSHLEEGCVMSPGVISVTEDANRVRIQEIADEAHFSRAGEHP